MGVLPPTRGSDDAPAQHPGELEPHPQCPCSLEPAARAPAAGRAARGALPGGADGGAAGPISGGLPRRRRDLQGVPPECRRRRRPPLRRPLRPPLPPAAGGLRGGGPAGAGDGGVAGSRALRLQRRGVQRGRLRVDLARRALRQAGRPRQDRCALPTPPPHAAHRQKATPDPLTATAEGF